MSEATNPLDLTWLERVIERFRLISEAEQAARTRQLEDWQFSYGDDLNKYQWDLKARQVREASERPMLTNNRTDQYCKRLVNDIGAEMPAGQVEPVDRVEDPQVASDIDGVIRYIQRTSDADIAHLTAVNQQVRMGIGYWRILPTRTGPNNRQDLQIKRIRNRFTVYLDPAAQDPAGADAWDGYITEDLDREAFLRRWPASTLGSLLQTGRGHGDVPAAWIKGQNYQVAEVWRRVPKPDADDEYQVEWAVINGIEILEGNAKKTGPLIYPIPFIPIVRAIADDFDDNGAVDYRGLTRGMRDPQRFSNYTDSQTAESVALTPEAAWVAAFGSLEGLDADYRSRNPRVLFYHPQVKGITGQFVTVQPPGRQVMEPAIQALTMLGQRASNNLRAAAGEVDADAAEFRPEQSGIAIQSRELQKKSGNSHFRRHLGYALRHEIRILLAWIPHIYDVPRQLQIKGKDDKAQTVILYAGAENAPSPVPEGVRAYDMANITFDVTVTDGPSFETINMESQERMGTMITAMPEVMVPLAGDKWLESTGQPWAIEVAARMKKQFKHEDKDPQKTGQPEIPPQVQQQMQQLGMMNEALTKELQAKTEFIESDQAKIQAETQRKTAELAQKQGAAEMEAQIELEKARIQAKTAVAIAQMKIRAEREIAEMKAQYALETASRDLRMDGQMRQADHTHEMTEAERGREHESEEAERTRAHTGQQADADREVTMHGQGADA